VAETVITAISTSGIKGRPVNAEVATGQNGQPVPPRPMRGGGGPRREGGFGGPRRDGGFRGGPRREGGYGDRRFGDR